MESLEELHRYQVSVIESIQQENNKQEEALKSLDIDQSISRARLYHRKLLTIKKDMDFINEKRDKLKVRALKLQEVKQREALLIELERERQKERDKQLSPVVRPVAASSATASSSSATSAELGDIPSGKKQEKS